MRNQCILLFRKVRAKISIFAPRHPYWCAFLMSAILGVLMMLPNIISGKGIFSWIADYSTQEIPFNTHLSEIAKSGEETLWEPHNDLGASTIGSYSFYNLTSPFVMVLWLFPASWIPYLLGIMYIVKYGLAGLTAYMFLSRVLRQKKYALLGSLFYAFSGFQFANMLFYHFHDCVALFPLLLYALDGLIKENKRVIFALVVALNLFTNYFFFIGEVVFLLIFYTVLCVTKYYKFTWKKFFQIALESLIGVGLGCVVLIPSILFVLNNPRVSNGWTMKSMFVPTGSTILEIIRAFIMPSQSMTYHAIINQHNWSSIEMYLPFVGSVLWLAYLCKKPKNPFSILTFVLSVFLIVPILNSTFVAFTTEWYGRWLYMFTLILSLLSAKALEDRIDLKKGLVGTGVLFVIFMILSHYYIRQGSTLIYDEKLFVLTLAIFAINIISLACLKRAYLFDGVVIGVCAYIVIYGGYNCWLHRSINTVVAMEKDEKILQGSDYNVRYNEEMYNGAYFAHRMSATTWNSNIEGTAFKFYESLDILRGVATKIPLDDHELNDFLSVKYIIANNSIDEDAIAGYRLKTQEGNLSLYENVDYLPFGIDYDMYITSDEFASMNAEERRKTLKRAVVLTDDQVSVYQNFLKHYNQKLRTSNITKNNFELIDNGFKADVSLTKDSLVVYTFAYSDNFNATVNGEPAQLIEVDNGLIGIKLHQGENHLEVVYQDKGFQVGLAIFITSLVALVCYSTFVFHDKHSTK